MEYIAIIQTSKVEYINKGKLYWRENTFSQIKKFLPPESLNPDNLKSGYIYLNNSRPSPINSQVNYSINITMLKTGSNYIMIEYELKEPVDLQSELIKSATRKYLRQCFQIAQNDLTPFLVIIPLKEFERILNTDKDKLIIENLFNNNRWQEIYDYIASSGEIENSPFWNDPLTLGKIGFALSKISECSINLKKAFKQENEIKEFLRKKRHYRKLTEKVLLRCIELDNLNPTYYSSIAYFYFQCATELTLPGGRRDDNFYQVIDKALINISKALELDHNRCSDHYRRAYIFSRLLLNRARFATSKIDNPKNFADTKLLIQEAIQSFQRAINVFENNSNDQTFKNLHLKIYLKSLYNLADIYESNINTKNEKIASLITKLFPQLEIEDIYTWKDYKIKKLQSALEYSEKCLRWINKKYIPPEEEQSIVNLISIEDSLRENPFIETTFKAYQISKILFKMYLLQKDKNYLDDVKRILSKTITLKTSSKLDILFVYNLLATVYILDDKPELAIQILNAKSKNKSLPDYASLTLAIAYIFNKQIENSLNILNQLLKRNNKLLLTEIQFWIFVINEIRKLPDLENYLHLGLIKDQKITNYETKPDEQKGEIDNFEKIISEEEIENIYQNLCLRIVKLNKGK